MYSLFKNALVFLMVMTFYAPLHAQNPVSCRTVLDHLLNDYYSRIERLFYEEGLRVKEVEIADLGNYVSHPKIRHISINKNYSVVEKRVALEHEVTHFTTDKNIEKNPTPQNVASGVRIIKWGPPIDKALPQEYQKEFRLDEIGAHFDESAFAFSLLPYFLDDPESAWLIKIYEEGLKESAQFARVAKKIIPKVANEIKKGRVADFRPKFFYYPKKFYDVFVSVYIDGNLVTLGIPLFETKLDPHVDRAQLDKKILSVLKFSLKYADSYLKKD